MEVDVKELQGIKFNFRSAVRFSLENKCVGLIALQKKHE